MTGWPKLAFYSCGCCFRFPAKGFWLFRTKREYTDATRHACPVHDGAIHADTWPEDE